MIPVLCNELSKAFRGVHAVDHLNLEIAPGSIYALIGPNGAGKTTALKTLMNILSPSGGEARILGTDSRRLGSQDFARIGYVSENQSLPEWMTVEYFMAYLKRFYPAWDAGLAERLLEQFSLPRDRKLGKLSRGMRMKAALASSLAYRPSLLILDEPFTGLDPVVREELIQSLLASADRATVLISSHDLAEIESFASHIGFMEEGRLRFSEPMTSLAERFREIEVTLEEQPPAIMDARWPSQWLRPEFSPALVRFVDTDFDPQRTHERVHEMFTGVRNISASPMPLRNIFLTLAKRSSRAPEEIFV